MNERKKERKKEWMKQRKNERETKRTLTAPTFPHNSQVSSKWGRCRGLDNRGKCLLIFWDIPRAGKANLGSKSWWRGRCRFCRLWRRRINAGWPDRSDGWNCTTESCPPWYENDQKWAITCNEWLKDISKEYLERVSTNYLFPIIQCFSIKSTQFAHLHFHA